MALQARKKSLRQGSKGEEGSVKAKTKAQVNNALGALEALLHEKPKSNPGGPRPSPMQQVALSQPRPIDPKPKPTPPKPTTPLGLPKKPQAWLNYGSIHFSLSRLMADLGLEKAVSGRQYAAGAVSSVLARKSFGI